MSPILLVIFLSITGDLLQIEKRKQKAISDEVSEGGRWMCLRLRPENYGLTGVDGVLMVQRGSIGVVYFYAWRNEFMESAMLGGPFRVWFMVQFDLTFALQCSHRYRRRGH